MNNGWLMAALLAPVVGVGRAQDTSPLDDAQRAAVVEDIGRTLTEGYIYADVGEKLAQHLRARLAAGAYESLTDRAAFAGLLSKDLFAMSNDKHLRIMPTRSSAGAASGRGGRRMVRRGGGAGGAQGGNSPGGGSWPGMPDFRRVNHGFQELRLLEDNVGYLDLRLFSPSPEARARVDASMAFFDGVDALIIDLGRNGGGAGTIVTYLSAYFFDEPTHLVDTFQRGMDEPSQRWTDKKIAGRPRPNLPVFLLTSPRTGSAAESFAFGLKVNNRVMTVGQRTAGAGHFGDNMRPLAHGFEMFLPIGRAYDPATGKGFEGEGVAPDVEVPYTDALREAHAMAVESGREYRQFLEEKDGDTPGKR